MAGSSRVIKVKVVFLSNLNKQFMEASEVSLSFSPYSHIHNRNFFEQLECTICFEIVDKVFRCKGPCHKVYCQQCVGKIKYTKDQCPSKCSSPFLYQSMPPLPLTYSCLYQCPILLLLTPALFQQHIQECPFMPPWAVRHFQMKKQFRCGQWHPLSLVSGVLLQQCGLGLGDFYHTVLNDLCAGYRGRGLCRAICLECSQVNPKKNVECRKIPLTKDSCPKGHPYELNSSNSYGCVCDRCGVTGPLKQGQSYSEHICDIFICGECFADLPNGEAVQDGEKTEVDTTTKEKLKLNSYFMALDDPADPFDL